MKTRTMIALVAAALMWGSMLTAEAQTPNLLTNGDFNDLPILGPGQTDVGVAQQKLISTNSANSDYSNNVSGIVGWTYALPNENGSSSDHGVARPTVFGDSSGPRMVYINNWGRMISQTVAPAVASGFTVTAQIQFGTAGSDTDFGRAGTFYLVAGEANPANRDTFSSRSVILRQVVIGNPTYTNEALNLTVTNHVLTNLKLAYTYTNNDPTLALPLTLAFRTEGSSQGPTYWDNASLIVTSNQPTEVVITTQPQSQVVALGTNALFAVSASGAQPLFYRWQFDGTNLSDAGNISGSATPALTISNIQKTNLGNYQVIVSNSFGSVTSAVAVLATNGQPLVPFDGEVFTWNVVLVPGVYQLPHGISIGASGITLDLNGATLVGSNFNGYGVTCISNNNAAVKNGNMNGYYYGILIENGTNVQVINNNLSGNWMDPNSRTANPPFLNINVGPDLGDKVNLGGGLYMQNVSGAVVSSNIMQNEENGMDLYYVTTSTIEYNNASGNTGWGVHLNGSISNVLMGNIADHCTRTNLNDSAGFLLTDGSSGNQVLSNSFQYGGDGFFIGNQNGCPSDNNLVQGNNGSYAGANAFEATFSSGNRFIGNIADFSNYGFWLGYSHDGNVISFNTIQANNINGIEIDHGQHNTIDANDIIGNGNSGIVLDTDGQTNFPVNTPCLDLPDPAASSFYTIRSNRIIGNYGSAMSLTMTTDSLIANNLFDGTVTSDGSNNVWSFTPVAGTNIVGGLTLGGNWWYNYSGTDTNGDGLGDTATPYTNAGQIAPPGDPNPLIGSPNLGTLSTNPQTLGNYEWIDLGPNTRSTGGTFNTANGTHFATDGTNLFLLEGNDSPNLSFFDPTTSLYVPKSPLPEGVQDGGDFQYGGGLFFATVGLGFDANTGAGNGSELYAYDPVLDSWSSKAPTTVNGQLVCNEALAYDPAGNRLYATIVAVTNGGDTTLLTKLAIFNPAANVWTGVTSASPDTWNNGGTEAEYLDGFIYVWRGGGGGADVDGDDSYLDVYNIASNSWSRTPSLRASGVASGFRTGGFDVWGIALSADSVHHRLFVLGAEANHQLYVFNPTNQTWAVGPVAPYDGGWGDGLEYVAASDRLYQIDGRNSGGTTQGSAVLLTFYLNTSAQSPGSINLNWNAVGGRSYQVQYATNLTKPTWVNLGGAIQATNSTLTTVEPTGPETQRFYRLLLTP